MGSTPVGPHPDPYVDLTKLAIRTLFLVLKTLSTKVNVRCGRVFGARDTSPER